MSEPSLLMGVAAPMLVAGAMEATCAGERQERACTGGPGTGRPHPHHHRDLRGQLRLHDLTRGFERAAGRVELDDHRGRTILGAAGDARAQVLGHDLVDDAGGGQHDDGVARSGSSWATTVEASRLSVPRSSEQ